jgi:hypothetical protein
VSCADRVCRVHAGRALVITGYQCVIKTVAGFAEFVFNGERGSRQNPTEPLVAQTTAPATSIPNIQISVRSLDSTTGIPSSVRTAARAQRRRIDACQLHRLSFPSSDRLMTFTVASTHTVVQAIASPLRCRMSGAFTRVPRRMASTEESALVSGIH